MVTPMIISFRECVEMLVVIIPLLAYLKKSNRLDLYKFVFGGCIAGAIASVFGGVLIFLQVGNLDGYAASIFKGSIMMFVAALTMYNIVWIGKQQKNFNSNIETKYKFSLTSTSLVLLSFLTIFRESLEIVIFILPSISKNNISIVIGIISGILGSIVIMYLFFRTALKLNLRIIFSILTVCLIIIGGTMFGEGLIAFAPSLGESGEKSGVLVYCIPLLYIFIKKEIKSYIKK